MRSDELHEALARDRKRYERLIYNRLKGGISWEDAEDIVSDALLRAHLKARSRPPRDGKAEAWFWRILANQGVDFLRARDGRRRNGTTGRPQLVPLPTADTEGGEFTEPVVDPDPGETWIEHLDAAGEHDQVRELVGRVLENLGADEARLIKLRHLVGADAPREKVAAMAGLTLGEFRWRYARAWAHFVEAVAAEQPTASCHRVRVLIGELEAGTAPTSASAEIDAHIVGCTSCRVFARDSYRALELMPVVPGAAFAEHWTSRLADLVRAYPPEAPAAAGTGAAVGVGASSLIGAGGTAGGLKLFAAVCGATALTASTCGGLLVLLDQPRAPRPKPAPATVKTAPKVSARPALMQRPAVAAGRPASARRAVTTTSHEAPVPAPAPPGAREFEPGGSSVPVQPAPAPATGGGEFTP